MVGEGKTLKQYCKEAKQRLKSGFWRDYRNKLNQQLEIAENNGISTSQVKEYYTIKVSESIKSHDKEKEEFYLKVKSLLDSEGEVPNAIGRLTDRKYFDTLSYEEKQRYTLTLSEKYLQAVERYRKEKAMNL